MTTARQKAARPKAEVKIDRLRLDPCPAGVREVVLTPRATLRYRWAGAYVEGTLYRLRQPTEQGPAVLRFANRRTSLVELLFALFSEAELQLDQRTVLWYLESTDERARAAS